MALVTVNTLNDSVDFTDGLTSLREAIFATNLVGGADSIEFASSLTSGGPATLMLTQGELAITDSLAINGPSANMLTIDASGHDLTPDDNNGDGIRIFNIDDGNSSSLIDVTISGLTLTGGDANGAGGAIFARENLTVANSTITGNATFGGFGGGAFPGGGGIYSASTSALPNSLTVVDSSITGNAAVLTEGGGIRKRFGDLIVERTAISGNMARTAGGGISAADGGVNVQIISSTISGNSATNGSGGGLFILFGTATITDSTISGNSARRGGGISGTGSDGVSVIGSTISGNSATNGSGGGIYGSNLTISQSTISGNSATIGGGGGISGFFLTMDHSTVVGNSATANGGGIVVSGRLNSTIDHTIIAGNMRTGVGASDLAGRARLSFSLLGVNAGATIIDSGGNLIGTSAATIDPILGPLVDNGGPTMTHAQLPGSPAINRGDLSAVAGVGGLPEFDQRGAPYGREFNGRIDIGAFEYQVASDLNLVVDTLSDESDGNYALGDLSLREALLLANTYPSTDTIRFDPALTAAGPAAITLTMGELVITDNTTIIGPGATFLTIDASGNDPTPNSIIGDGIFDDDYDGSRVFNIDNGNSGDVLDVSISGLMLTGSDGYYGGAIFSRERLTITASEISGNTAVWGGGIYSAGDSTSVVDSEISGNSAFDGVAIFGSGNITVLDSTMSNNATPEGSGGTVRFYSSGELAIINSTISGNMASGVVGGNRVAVTDSTISNNIGGGILGAGNLTVTNSMVSGNSAYGGIRLYGSSAIIVNSTISGNSAFGSGGGISNTKGDLIISNSTISGNSAGDSFQSGGGGIYNDRGRVTVSESTISGNSTGNSTARLGGGIFNRGGNVAFADSVISGNTADQGGGIFAANRFDDSGGSSILFRSNITLTRTLLDGNSATNGGGIFNVNYSSYFGGSSNYSAGDLIIHDSTITGNMADEDGGAIYSHSGGVLEITSSTISGNSTGFDGGGILLRNRGADFGTDPLDNFTVNNSTIANNVAGRNGGGIGFYGAFISFPSFGFTLTGSTISGNSAGMDGGGIWTGFDGRTLIESSTIADNSAARGGGIFSRGYLAVTTSIVIDNQATGDGGGIHSNGFIGSKVTSASISGNSAGGKGGGMHFRGVIASSTISGNSASIGGGISSDGNLTLTNSTISGNAASANSGGLYLFRPFASSIRHSTITANTASGFGGGVSVIGGTLSLDHTIVARNSAGLGFDVVGSIDTVIDARFSLIGDNTGSGLAEAPVGSPDAMGNVIGGPVNGTINPLLSPLADNGGPTQTHALLVGSPAIDTGDPTAVAGAGNVPQFDQRGAPFTRVNGGRIDIGAIERQSVPSLSLIVDTLIDESDGDYTTGDLSLREAIGLANGSVNPLETISFAPVLTMAGPATIVLTSGELAIHDTVTINGPGANLLTIDASGNDPTPAQENSDGSRLFNINDANNATLITATVSGLKLTGGDVDGSGGAIYSRENLHIADMVITGNSASTLEGRGGGGVGSVAGSLSVVGSTISGNTGRGGVFVVGSANIVNSTINSNAGGGIYTIGQLTVDHSVISGNTATTNPVLSGNGIFGGTFGSQSLTVRDSLIVDNVGSGISFSSGSVVVERTTISDNNYGVAINGGNTTITGSIIRENSGGVSNNFGTMTITSSTISNNAGRGVRNLGSMVIIGSTISGNVHTPFQGGGIANLGGGNLSITKSTISNNSAQRGGGIFNSNNGAVTITQSTISGNSAQTDGGGISNYYGALTITESVISGNSAQRGGGIWAITNQALSSTLIVNSTISGNTASNRGGGIYHRRGSLTARFSTITANSAAANGGGVAAAGTSSDSNTRFLSTIVAGNTNADVQFISSADTFVSLGYNLIGTGNANARFNQPGDQIGILDPMLGPLADNGGPTKTHALLPGSPAIDAGDPAAAPGVGDVPMYDQRGEPFGRVFGGRIDIGAFELQPIPPAVFGDYNQNGTVDSGDYVLWRKSFGTSGITAYSGADGDGDTMIDQDDYGVWRSHFGQMVSSPGSAAGEASSVQIQEMKADAPAARNIAADNIGEPVVQIPTETISASVNTDAAAARASSFAALETRSTGQDLSSRSRRTIHRYQVAESDGDGLILLLAIDRVWRTPRQDSFVNDDSGNGEHSADDDVSESEIDDPLAVAYF